MYFDLGEIGNTRTFLMQSEMGTVGPSGATLVVYDAIKALSPGAVIMVGIAFGLRSGEQQLGDILVSRQLVGYEVQRVAVDPPAGEVIKDLIEPTGMREAKKVGAGSENWAITFARGDRPHASPRLLDRFRASVFNWSGPMVHFGLILSGDKLVDSVDFPDKLLHMEPEAIGGELEATSVYSAAYQEKVDWIVVKAICDWVDGHKDKNKAVYQQQAAENAARFTLHALKQEGYAQETWRASAPFSTTNSKPFAIRHKQGTLLRRYDTHSSWVLAVAWEPDGTHIASAGGDGTVRVWEAGTGQELATYYGQTRLLNKVNIQTTIYTLAWSPEGLRIASGGSGPKVHVWSAATGQTLALYEGHSGLLPYVWAIAWSPDGKRIASACSITGLDKTVHIWNPDTGQTLTRYNASSGLVLNFAVFSLAWSPDGTSLAAACADKVIRVWNTETGQLISTHHLRSEWSSHLAWSPDSRYLAFTEEKHTVQIRDMVTEAVRITYHGHTDSVRCISWSPDAILIATASNDKTVQIWETLTGKHIHTYTGHSDWVTSVAWSPDGTRIASGSNDKTVQVWQAI
jgi:WD40 repeat protein/nucleoside phosphorylase